MYQSDPSGGNESCGREFGVGTSNPLIGTFDLPTATKATIVASIVKKHSLRKDMLLSLLACLVPNALRPEWNYSPQAGGGLFSEISEDEG